MSLPKPKVNPPAVTPPAPMQGADELKLGGGADAGTTTGATGRLKLRTGK